MIKELMRTLKSLAKFLARNKDLRSDNDGELSLIAPHLKRAIGYPDQLEISLLLAELGKAFRREISPTTHRREPSYSRWLRSLARKIRRSSIPENSRLAAYLELLTGNFLEMLPARTDEATKANRVFDLLDQVFPDGPRNWSRVRIHRLWWSTTDAFQKDLDKEDHEYSGESKKWFEPKDESRSSDSVTRLRDVFISGHGFFFIDNELILADPGSEPGADFVSGHSGLIQSHHLSLSEGRVQRVLLRGDSTKTLEKGFDMIGRNSSNYWHSLIEYAPRLKFYQREMGPILASYDFPLAIKHCLKLLLPKRTPVVYVRRDESVFINRLEVAKYFTAAYDSFGANMASLAGLDDSGLQWLREQLFDRLGGVPTGESPKKFFVNRESNYRNANGWDELTQALVKQGFSAVNLSGLGIADQIQLFGNANEIVGVGGAHWANLIFCRPGTKVHSLTSAAMAPWVGHETIASKFDVQYTCIVNPGQSRETSPDWLSYLHGDFSIDKKHVLETINERNAY